MAYSHNLVKVCMKCDYTHLNHNLLVSQKKVITKGVIIKGVYCILNDINKKSLKTQYILNLGQLMQTIDNIKKFLIKKLNQLRFQPLLIKNL